MGNNYKNSSKKIYVIKLIKEKIRPRSWDTYYKLNVVQNILVWVLIWFIMAKEIGKGNGKGFGKENGIKWHFIYENNGN